MLRLKCAAQTYAWGRPAAESEVIVKGERRRTVDRRCNASFPPSFRQGTRGAMDASPARIGPFFGRALRLPFPREQRESSHERSWCLSIGAQGGPRRLSAAPWNGRAERKKKRETARSREALNLVFKTSFGLTLPQTGKNDQKPSHSLSLSLTGRRPRRRRRHRHRPRGPLRRALDGHAPLGALRDHRRRRRIERQQVAAVVPRRARGRGRRRRL